jgi:HlyD family secretion protein
VDRELSPDIIRKAKRKKYIRAASAILVLIVCFIVFKSIISPTVARSKLLTSTAEIGTVEATVTASGTVIPRFEQVITSPIPSKIEYALLNAGDSARKGEPILQLNRESIQTTFAQLEDELELQKNRKEQLNLQLQRHQIDLQAAYDIKELQTQYKASQLEQTKHLQSLGGATGEDLNRAELDLEIARREREQLASQMENQQASLLADLNELDIQIRIQESRIAETRRQIKLAEARAERDGIVTWINDDIGATVFPGDVIARIADLSSFRVEATISDFHADKLTVGGPVKVRINDRHLTGHINSVRPTVQNGIMTFIIELDENSDPSLRHNLRVDVYVVTTFKDSVVRVRNGAFYKGKRDQKLFIVNGDRAVRKIVDIGESNIDFVEIIGDISEGDEVIISDMKRYEHMETVDITNE